MHWVRTSKVLIVPLWNWNGHPRYGASKEEGFNCTFMELKCLWDSIILKSVNHVLIVPLWNWNTLACVLFVALAGFNCTFMELKLAHVGIWKTMWRVLIVPLWNWNVTTGYAVAVADTVLIVPLWNWNYMFNWFFCSDSSFNCTFMELKSQHPHH